MGDPAKYTRAPIAEKIFTTSSGVLAVLGEIGLIRQRRSVEGPHTIGEGVAGELHDDGPGLPFGGVAAHVVEPVTDRRATKSAGEKLGPPNRSGMAARQRLDPNLAAAVERGRARAATAGELTPRRIGPIESVFTDEAREIVAEWQRDGGYECALVAITASDPDLAIQ